MIKWLVNNKFTKTNQDQILINIMLITITKLKINNQARNIIIIGRVHQIKTIIQINIIINNIKNREPLNNNNNNRENSENAQ